MSRQFRIYALPTDLERLTDELRAKVGLQLIHRLSPTMQPLAAESVYDDFPKSASPGEYVRADCYFAPTDSLGIKCSFLEALSIWSVDEVSEVVEVSGCDFDGSTLVQGRFYFQSDFLSDAHIIPKRIGFLTWADKVFRVAKSSLHRSKALDAYIGEDAADWRRSGGRFASMLRTNDLGPLYEDAWDL